MLPLGAGVDPSQAVVRIAEAPVWIGKPGLNGTRRAVRLENAVREPQHEEADQHMLADAPQVSDRE